MLLDGKDVLTKEIQVWDPVSHCRFHWTQQTTDDPLPPKLAFVTCRPKTLRYTEFNPFEITFDIADGTTTHGDTTTRVEHLTPLQTDGITISRLRVTNEFHDGQGNVSKLSTETWYSPDLKELIRIGEEETGYQTLTNIRRIDPDPKLFYPPEGYRIEQQSGP